MATYIDHIMEAIQQCNDAEVKIPSNEDLIKLLQNNLDLKAILTKHLETIEKTNNLATKIKGLHINTISGTPQYPLIMSYRDALLSNTRNAPPSMPNTPGSMSAEQTKHQSMPNHGQNPD